jgi:predicted Zn-dependent protease
VNNPVTNKTRCNKTRRHRLAVSHAALLVSLVVAGCSGTAFLERQAILSEPPRQKAADPQTPAQREHARILSAYGGAYENPKLQPLIDSWSRNSSRRRSGRTFAIK